MKFKNAYLYLSLVVIHTVLLFIAFPAFFQHYGDMMFSCTGDGFKNYFTLASYVSDPHGAGGLFKYNSFSYPFGDYVYYTDNTPFFSIPFKWFCYQVHDISAYAIPAFNFFILANIVVSSLFVFFIFKRLLGKNLFSYSLALFLPWINLQVPRLWEGDFNLSCTLPVLLAIALFIKWYDSRGNTRKQIITGSCMVLLLFFSFLLHGYYIGINASFLAGMLFFSGALCFRNKSGKQDLLASVIIPLLSLACVLSLLYITDKYLGIRQQNAMGYDAVDQKTNFSLLFTHYDFHGLAFPIASTKAMGGEMMVYLGNIGLFAFAAIWTGSVFNTDFRKQVFSIQREFFSDPVKRSIFLGASLSFAISFGEWYNTNRDEFKIYTPFPSLNNVNTGTLLTGIIAIALVIYGIVLLTSTRARGKINATGRDYARHPYRKAGLLLCIALMIFLFIGLYSVHVPNIVNPFFYIHFFTRRVEQFRSLSRFSWPFFWAFYIWIMYTLIQLYHQSANRARAIISILFMLVGILEVKDYISKNRLSANNSNLLATHVLKKYDPLKIDFNQYQAILPVPYYNIGSEDFPHTIDDNNDWSTYTMQLSLYSHLPLMSCKMSRTPPEFSVALLDMAAYDTLQPILKNKISNKPILIVVQKTLVNDPTQIETYSSGRPLTRIYYAQILKFTTRHPLSPIDSAGDVYFYSWIAK